MAASGSGGLVFGLDSLRLWLRRLPRQIYSHSLLGPTWKVRQNDFLPPLLTESRPVPPALTQGEEVSRVGRWGRWVRDCRTERFAEGFPT